MPNLINWGATGTSRTTGIAGDTIAAGSNEIGSAIDNDSNLDRFMDVELVWTCSVASNPSTIMELYILYSVDGTNYEDGSDSVDPFKPPAGTFIDDGGTGAQRQIIHGIPITPHKFKLLLKSELNQDASSVTLRAYTYNEEVQ
jgi:hypothetical protein